MNNPIPRVLQEGAKALFALVTWADFPPESEAKACALGLEHSLIAFFNVNEHDELDDRPDDGLVTLEQVEASRAATQEFISEGQSPVEHPRKLNAEDKAWLKQMGIARTRKRTSRSLRVQSVVLSP